MNEDDFTLTELKETIRSCRRNIRRRLRNDNLLVPNVTWDSIWKEMRNIPCPDLLTTEIENKLKSWFQLWEEFPTERSSGGSLNSPKCWTDSYYSHVVHPGDLWIDCGNRKDDASGVSLSNESCIARIGSSLQSIKETDTPPGLKEIDKNIRRIREWNLEEGAILLNTKPWWSYNIPASRQNDQAAANQKLDDPQIASETLLDKLRRRQMKQAKTSGDPDKTPSRSQPRSVFPNKRDFANSYYSTPRCGDSLKAASRIGISLRPRDAKLKVVRKVLKQKVAVCSNSISLPISSQKLDPCPTVSNKKIKALRKKLNPPGFAPQELHKSALTSSADELSKSKKIFPPGDYVYKKGDWVAHAIMSSSTSSDDLRMVLKDRGYELKYIMNRKCTLLNKWICSLIVSADRTHVLTSENIWLKGWEVDFVCNEEDISVFLKD